MRWTRVARLTSALPCGRRSRVVLTPRRWRQVGEEQASRASDGDKKARSPGRARSKPLKPSRAGMPGDPGATVVTNARVFYSTRAAAGASGTRHSLRPLSSEGAMRTREARGIVKLCRRHSRAIGSANRAPVSSRSSYLLAVRRHCFRWLGNPDTSSGVTGGGQMVVGQSAPPAAAHPLVPNPGSASDEKRPDPQPDFRILPPGRHGGIDLRPPRRQ